MKTKMMLLSGFMMAAFLQCAFADRAPVKIPLPSPTTDILFYIAVGLEGDPTDPRIAGATCTLYRRKIQDNTETMLYSRLTNEQGIVELTTSAPPPEGYNFIVRC